MASAVRLEESGFLDVAGQHLEYRFTGPQPQEAPTLILLHEGLGCAALWGRFPGALAQVTGCGVFAYSRAGYGRSGPVSLPRPLTYMHDEAAGVLPALLDAIALQRGILVGHSDGASIAAIYAGSQADHRIRGLCLLAPHFFVEDISISSIAAAKIAYETSDLREKLARWHDNVDIAFRGWNDAWLDPDFRQWDIREFLAYIRVPVLVIQGAGDQYGTIAQVEAVKDETYCPVDVVMMTGVKHTPFREAPEKTCQAIGDFCNHIFVAHGEKNPQAGAAQ